MQRGAEREADRDGCPAHAAAGVNKQDRKLTFHPFNHQIPMELGAPVVFAVDPTDFGARLAAAFFGFPAEKMATFIVAGAHGKTSTAWVLRSILEHENVVGNIVGRLSMCSGPFASEPPGYISHELKTCIDVAGLRPAVYEAVHKDLAALMQRELARDELRRWVLGWIAEEEPDSDDELYEGREEELAKRGAEGVAKARAALEARLRGNVAAIAEQERAMGVELELRREAAAKAAKAATGGAAGGAGKERNDAVDEMVAMGAQFDKQRTRLQAALTHLDGVFEGALEWIGESSRADMRTMLTHPTLAAASARGGFGAEDRTEDVITGLISSLEYAISSDKLTLDGDVWVPEVEDKNLGRECSTSYAATDWDPRAKYEVPATTPDHIGVRTCRRGMRCTAHCRSWHDCGRAAVAVAPLSPCGTVRQAAHQPTARRALARSVVACPCRQVHCSSTTGGTYVWA
jgi:hypothetical protein